MFKKKFLRIGSNPVVQSSSSPSYPILGRMLVAIDTRCTRDIVNVAHRTIGCDRLSGRRRQGFAGRLLRRARQHDVRRERQGSFQRPRRRYQVGEHPRVVRRTRLDPVGARLPDPVERVFVLGRFSRRPDGHSRRVGQTHWWV